MANNVTETAIVGGVDTHKDLHVAAVIDQNNKVLGTQLESFFGTLKAECYYLNEYKSVEGLKRDIISYIDYYNNLIIREKFGGLNPVEYRLRQAA